MIKISITPLVTITLLSCAISFGSFANENSGWKDFNLIIVKRHIIPRYDSLAHYASELYESSVSFCESPTEESLGQMQIRYHQVMDAWQNIQHIQFGPIEYANRSSSIQYWPDKKNHTGKHLTRLIESEDTKKLGKGFVNLSVSIKGLPAIERLLFSYELASFESKPFHCQVLTRITMNMSDIGAALAKEWKGSMLPQFEDASQVDGYFEDDIDAATALLKAMVEPIEIIKDLKLKRPMASKLELAKFKRLESWRTARSLKNIQLNLGAIEDISFALGKITPQTDAKELANHFQDINSVIKDIGYPIEETLLTPHGYQSTLELIEALDRLHMYLEAWVKQRGINLGFNSRDGD